MDAAEARTLFERELDTIERLIQSVSRRYGLVGDDADSFLSVARLRIIENEYAVIRKFSGRSSLRTYLYAVVANLYRDFRIQQWGKWRPSAISRRLGPSAVLLDTFINRDGDSVEEALGRLQSRDDVNESEAELRQMAMKIPRRSGRSFSGLGGAVQLAAEEEADTDLLRKESHAEAHQVLAALEEAMAELPPQDQLILKLRFLDGLSVASVARTLRIEQKPLYRRIEGDLKMLRTRLESLGVDARHVSELISA